MKLSEIAERMGGALEGDGDIERAAVAGLKEAEPGVLSFLANPKYASLVAETGASAVIVPNDWDRPVKCSLIRVENSDQAFAEAAELFYEPVPAAAAGVRRRQQDRHLGPGPDNPRRPPDRGRRRGPDPGR